MFSSVMDIEAQALGLTPRQRAHLAGKLLSRLSPDAEIEEAWSAEAIRRLEEMENGSVTGIAVEETIARAPRDSVIVSTHPLADEELVEDAVYYARQVNAALAGDFIAEFERSVALLRQYPRIGSPWRGGV